VALFKDFLEVDLFENLLFVIASIATTVVFSRGFLAPRRTWHMHWLKQESALYDAMPESESKQAIGNLVERHALRYVEIVLSFRKASFLRWTWRVVGAAGLVFVMALGDPHRETTPFKDSLLASALTVVFLFAVFLTVARLDLPRPKTKVQETEGPVASFDVAPGEVTIRNQSQAKRPPT
jgi:hypothetical protein